ncbi:MAG: DEAD/DEAH box helicase family protein [Candidatus Heimdallarchaeota archaeon]|nr:DEAD/DEAH box helicase family protein [Candidatus Heimdallarchaeota archaeon]
MVLKDKNTLSIMEQAYDFNTALTKTIKMFPYARPNSQQVQIINAILELKEKGILLVEASTGSGKTIASLSALLSRRQYDEKIIVITRTISQMEPVVKEWSKIVGGFEGLKEGGKPLILPILGKAKLCKQLPYVQQATNFDAKAVHMLCKSMECKLYPFSKSHGYSYFHDFKMSPQYKSKNLRRLLLNTNFALAGKKKHGGSAIDKIYQIYGKQPSCGYYDQRDLIS